MLSWIHMLGFAGSEQSAPAGGATDQDGVEELLPWLDPDTIRFCPRHRIAFAPDPHVYRHAHAICPVGGERLESVFARWRTHDGAPLPHPTDDPA
jgi:hypothetical protein